MTSSVEVLRSRSFEAVPHVFLCRRRGVSTVILAGLNVGLVAGDDHAAIAENRRRAIDAVHPATRLVTLHQVHSATAVTVTTPYPDDAHPHADAMVTDQPGLLLGKIGRAHV